MKTICLALSGVAFAVPTFVALFCTSFITFLVAMKPVFAQTRETPVFAVSRGDCSTYELFFFTGENIPAVKNWQVKAGEKAYVLHAIFFHVVGTEKVKEYEKITGEHRKVSIMLNGKIYPHTTMTPSGTEKTIVVPLASPEELFELAKALWRPPVADERKTPEPVVFTRSAGDLVVDITPADVSRVVIMMPDTNYQQIYKGRSPSLVIQYSNKKLAEFLKIATEHPGKMVKISVNGKIIGKTKIPQPKPNVAPPKLSGVELAMRSPEEAFEIVKTLIDSPTPKPEKKTP
jgi:hypothetical protein